MHPKNNNANKFYMKADIYLNHWSKWKHCN